MRCADLAPLFRTGSAEFPVPDGFEVVPTIEGELTVAESSRHGAPMTLVRGGEGCLDWRPYQHPVNIGLTATDQWEAVAFDSASNTRRPPTNVMSTRALRISSRGISKMFSPSITKSASRPGAMVPFRASSNEA